VAENVQGGEIPDCGHWIPEEKPEELLRELLAFFQSNANHY
jgi:pimeloyl-ACP methyl ester carboxylesterase